MLPVLLAVISASAIANTDLLIIAIALIVILGYIANSIFRITKIPEVLVLITLGALMVPVLHILPNSYVAALRNLTPLFGTVALIMIMYGGGEKLKLNVKELADPRGYVLALLDVFLIAIIITVVMYFIFGWPLIYSAILGVVLGGTSSVVVITIISRLKISQKLYNVLLIETTLNSVVQVVVFSLLLVFLSGHAFSAASYTEYVVSNLSVGAAIGVVVAIGWLFLQSLLKGARNYLATLAVAFLLYGAVDFLGGSALVAILLFAIIVGNAQILKKYLKIEIPKRGQTGEAVKQALEFLVRTFFFVFIGMIAYFSTGVLVFAAAALAIILAVRWIEVKLVHWESKNYQMLAYALLPRDLTTAVLASIIYSFGGQYAASIFGISFIIIITTDIISAVLVSKFAKGAEKAAAGAKERLVIVRDSV